MTAQAPRLSKHAVVAAAMGLLTCVPLVGLLGLFVSIAALYRISVSRGQLGGRTLAFIGLLLASIGSAGWLSLALGARQEYARLQTGLIEPASDFLRGISDGKYIEARAWLDPQVAVHATDERLASFQRRVAERLGQPRPAPQAAREALAFILEGRELSEQLAPLLAGRDPTPIYSGGPIRFDLSTAYIAVEIAPGAPPMDRFPRGHILDVLVLTPGAPPIRLADTP